MNEYELIGRLAYLDTRLKKLEGVEPIQQPQPAPVPKLVEAVEKFMPIQENLKGADNENWNEYDKALKNVRLALAAEKRRQELIDELFETFDECRHVLPGMVLDAIDKIDAFDKERGK